MTQTALAGFTATGSFTPFQLIAGYSQPIVAQTYTVGSGIKSGSTDDTGRISKAPILALVSGKLALWNQAGAGDAAIPFAVSPHLIDTTATGTNADTELEVWISGEFNYDFIATTATFAQLRAAAAKTDLIIRQLTYSGS